jgi:hypothetical protein
VKGNGRYAAKLRSTLCGIRSTSSIARQDRDVHDHGCADRFASTRFDDRLKKLPRAATWR